MLALCMLFAQVLTAEPDAPAAAAEEVAPVGAASAVEAETVDAPATDADAAAQPRSVKITSARTDYDRKQGVIMFDEVAITNDLRAGTCAKATYTKATQKIVMYGDGDGTTARLADNGRRRSEVEGRKITFWIDSEQVEVEGSTVTLDAGSLGGKDGAKKLLGK